MAIQFVELPSFSVLLLSASPFILLGIFTFFRYVLWFVAGLIWALSYSLLVQSRSFDAELEGRDVFVSGYVISLPYSTDRYTQFNFKISEIRDEYGKTRNNPGLIRLYWYKPYPVLKPGKHLSLLIRAKRPHGLMNPGGYDYEAWLFRAGVRATGYVRSSEDSPESVRKRITIHNFRYYIAQQLDEIAAGHSSRFKLIYALILGDRSRLEVEQREILSTTGTSHLLAISGLHIGLVASFAFFLSRWIWPIWTRGVTRLPAQYFASLFSLLIALFYALLAGFTIPTQRALIMLTLVLLNVLRSRKVSKSMLFTQALFIVLLFDPLAVLAPGFWLSFLAMAIIMFALNVELIRDKFSKIRQWFRVQIYIYIGLVPVLVLIFNHIPIISLMANFIAIPWVSLITMPLLLSATLMMSISIEIASLLILAGMTSLNLLWSFLEFLSGWDFLLQSIPEPGLLTILTAVFGIILLLMPKALPCKVLAILWVLPLLFPKINGPDYGDYDVNVLDVGQGLSIVVRTQNRLLLYDTGPGSLSGFNAGSSVIIPYLKYSGHRKIDMIVQSHGDNDHIGGLNEIIKRIPVKSILTSIPQQSGFISAKYCQAGQSWNWNGVKFEILHPDDSVSFKGNNASCVLKIGHGLGAVLLTGDIEKRAESHLLKKTPANLRATVLIAPHHGSNTSSGSGFIRAVSPETVVFSSGYLNRYKLPNQDIIKRYSSSGAKLFNTATDGAISIRFRDGDLSVLSERAISSKFWNFKE